MALINKNDQYHKPAKIRAKQTTQERIPCHTSIPILFEIADGFSRIGRRKIGVDLIENIINSNNFIVHTFSESTFVEAKKLYISRKDKEWGLTDCYSFLLMQERKLSKVLTSDKHFQQFGFEVLL
ncbi:MAG TPA: PIN domain-containing protein [bacterium]|nr:PIN domain-containing protein [bacterium]